MAAPTVLPVMNGERTLHPFFAKTNSLRDDNESLSTDDASSTGQAQLGGGHDESRKHQSNGRSKKPRNEPLPKKQKTLQELVNPTTNGSTERAHEEEEQGLGVSELALRSSPRQKRRRTNLAECAELPPDNNSLETAAYALDDASPRRQGSPQVIIPVSSPLPIPNIEPDGAAIKTTTPKKMLRLNASGKFSSPISQKPKGDEPPADGPKRRGRRPRKSKELDQEKRLLVAIKYDVNANNTGGKIDRILAGEERHELEVKIRIPKKQRTPRKPRPAKSTHPFFLTKPKDPVSKKESPRKASAVTPGKLRRQTMEARSPVMQTTRPSQDYVVGSDLLKDRLMFKHPGAKDPAWPSKDQAHVRGLEQFEIRSISDTREIDMPYGRRKRKTARVSFPPEESVLRLFYTGITPEEEGELRDDGFRDPHPSLTMPKRLLISGEELSSRVAQRLSVRPIDTDEDEIIYTNSPQRAIHPAVQKLHNRIPTTLSAFDEGRGETLSWMQKYEPANTSELLQPAREMHVLRDWLVSLTITAVEHTLKSDTKAVTRSEPKPKKKRRRKADDLDDFLVSDDEEIRDMDELPDPEDTMASHSADRKVAKSVVQMAGEGVKLSNAVLLSGPHGCGKTAAAHAIARELGFKVFEISPCERRSGRDVLDKVGNMTENHLVKHHGTDAGDISASEEPNRIDEAFQRDLASGRQGKMNSFFKPKAPPKEALPLKQAVQKKQIMEAVQKAAKKPPKDQQQSLILLEEVDVLFKDDKDFWTTIFKLVASSKRPFIMTCNDEDLVPLQAMSLHAILRLSPPPVDLATDYLLLMAANEGHLLQRNAVMSLYQSKGCDLRASIAELNFWCQMGVGDPRGGLSWIYQRFPPGCDRDARGRSLRVVSEGTYQSEMGLSIDRALDHETQLLWTKCEYGTDVVDILGWNDDYGQISSLKSFCSIADALSATDVYTAWSDCAYFDTSQPPMSDKARSQYIEGMALLQTDETPDYTQRPKQLATASTFAIFRQSRLLDENNTQSRLKEAILSDQQKSEKHPALSRRDFACFDAIALPAETTLTGSGLAQSVFDGPLNPVVTDLAPYVRSIAHFDLALAEQRERLSSIMSEGRSAKRARTTRAARSALEGSQRSTTRRERWFSKDLNLEAVLATGGKEWPRITFAALTDEETSRDGTETPTARAQTPVDELGASRDS